MVSWPLFGSEDDKEEKVISKGFISVTHTYLEEDPRVFLQGRKRYHPPHTRAGIQSWNDEEEFLSCKFIAAQSQRVFHGIQPWMGCPLAWQVLQYVYSQPVSIDLASEFVDIFILFQTGTGHLISGAEILHVLPTSKGRLRFLCFPVLPNNDECTHRPVILGIATHQRVIPLSPPLEKYADSTPATFELEGQLSPKPPKNGYHIVGIPIAMEIHIY